MKIEQIIISPENYEEISKQNILIVKLGIQAYPGTEFYLDKNLCKIGPTGIFDFDFSNISIKPTNFSIQRKINSSHLGEIIIDLIYEEGGIA